MTAPLTPSEKAMLTARAVAWQAVARNLALILNDAAELADSAGDPVRALGYRKAFDNQCESHRLTPTPGH